MSANLHSMILGSILGGIWDGIQAAVVDAVNAIIVALGYLISGLLSVLPSMPTLPSLPSEFTTAEGWVAWIFPVDAVANVIVWGATVWVVWQLAAIVLRWAKALNS